MPNLPHCSERGCGRVSVKRQHEEGGSAVGERVSTEPRGVWGFCDDLTTLHLPGGVIPTAGGVSSAVGSTATPAPGPSIEMEEGKHGGTPPLVGAMREGEGGGESGVEGAVGREAAVAEEDYLKAAEIKRSMAELVEHREAAEKSVAEADTKWSAAAAGTEASEAAECVICMDQRKNHVLVPCGHLCVCQACAERITEEGETCPICRTAVREAVAVYQ